MCNVSIGFLKLFRAFHSFEIDCTVFSIGFQDSERVCATFSLVFYSFPELFIGFETVCTVFSIGFPDSERVFATFSLES